MRCEGISYIKLQTSYINFKGQLARGKRQALITEADYCELYKI